MAWFRCGGGGGGEQVVVTPALITDVSGFTKVYDTSSSVDFGSRGSRVSSALDITDADVLTSYMMNGWNDSHGCFYDSENKIGAYAGYDFGEEINIDKVDFWLGKYSGQNKTLYATVQYLDNSNNWNDLVDVGISSTIGYPLNVFSVYFDRKCYGIRWIHKNGDTKTSGNNIVFFGMTMYKFVPAAFNKTVPLIPEMTSNTTPSGVASASTEYNSNYYAYKAFDRSTQSLWSSSDGVSADQWIKYDFGSPTQVCAMSFVNRDNSGYAVGEFKLQGSLDDTNWVDIDTVDSLSVAETEFIPLDAPVRYRYYRWYVVSNVSGSSNAGTGFIGLQLYGTE